MFLIKNYQFVIILMLLSIGTCRGNSETTFEFLFPLRETRSVVLERGSQRFPLAFARGDSLQEASVTLALTGGEYARLWVGDLPYTIWLEPEKPWIARFEGNRWYFEGKGADVNAYLNKHFLEQVYFMDYYRVRNTEFREKLDRVSRKREEALLEAALDPLFVEQEMKRLRYIKSGHVASGVVYGEVKDGKMDLLEDTFDELQKAVVEDTSSWRIPEYRESIDRVMLALAKSEEMGKTFYDVTMNVLNRTTGVYKDKRLIEYVVNKNTMAYVKALGTEGIGRIDSIFKMWVYQPELIAAYNEACDANRRLMKGQSAVPFTFLDVDGKEVSLSDLKGKYVYIDIWATWCGPCVAEIPHLKKLEEHFRGRNVCFVSISSDRDREMWKKFVKERGMGGVQLHAGQNDEFMKAICCSGLPHFLLIDRDGKFIDANMSRPSELKTLKVLDGLEGM